MHGKNVLKQGIVQSIDKKLMNNKLLIDIKKEKNNQGFIVLTLNTNSASSNSAL